MMRTTELLKIMADKKPRSVKQLAAESGMAPREVYLSLVSLLRSEFAESEPVKYQITGRGLARSRWKPMTRRELNERQNGWLQERRRAARTVEVEKAASLDQSARTMRASAPNSVFALGSMS
jgi:DNA-binding IclR family transcriptional regulator